MNYRPYILLAGVMVFSIIGFYAVIGLVYFHHVRPISTKSSTCDIIITENEITWCKAVMNSQDDSMIVLRPQ